MSITEDEDFDDTDGVEYEIISVDPNVHYESEDESNEKFESSTTHFDHNETSIASKIPMVKVEEIAQHEDENSNSSDILKTERKRLKLEDYKKRRANIKEDDFQPTKPLFDLPRRIAVELCDIPSLPPIILPTDPDECLKLASMAYMPRTNPRDDLYRKDRKHIFSSSVCEEIVLVSTGCNTDTSISPTDVSRNGGGKTLLNDIVRDNKDEVMLTSSMSLFSSIQAVVVQGSKSLNEQNSDKIMEEEHGEEKIIMHLSKNRLKPFSCSVNIQTDSHPLFPPLLVSSAINSKPIRNFRRKTSRSRTRSRSFSPEYDRKIARYARSQHSTHSSSMYSSNSSSEYEGSESESDSTYSSERSSSDSLKRLNQRQNFKFYNRNQRTETYKEYREERRVVYIGHLEEEVTKEDLRRSFLNYGTIKKISMHAKEDGLRFGFVTFAEVQSAYEVIGKYRSDPILSKYDVRFGGRRKFCKQSYADLDSLPVEEYQAPHKQQQSKDLSFEDLLNLTKKKMALKK